ncbi:MAG: hypothetical protein GY854_12065, partial [Deltaproteobacteria bacterium]|nr:hypothetical protein [Deltaproteobacteria bacterium]
MSRVSRNLLTCMVVFAVTLGLVTLWTGSAQAQQTQIKPSILLIFDTSGSMTWHIDTPTDSEGSGSWMGTYGDGSWDPWGSRFCCPGTGGSRLYIAKEAMRQMIFATGDIEFSLMK